MFKRRIQVRSIICNLKLETLSHENAGQKSMKNYWSEQ